MVVHNFAFPVLEGREEDARLFGRDAAGEHRAFYDSLMHASGTTRVTWTLDQTPVGSFVLVWFEAVDPQAIFGILSTSTDAAAAWMRDWITRVSGLDITQPPPGPPQELILEWPG